jgi:hypothetical protein
VSLCQLFLSHAIALKNRARTRQDSGAYLSCCSLENAGVRISRAIAPGYDFGGKLKLAAREKSFPLADRIGDDAAAKGERAECQNAVKQNSHAFVLDVPICEMWYFSLAIV